MAAFLSFSSPSKAETETLAQNTDAQNSHFFFSDKVNITYGNELKFIQKYTPNLSVLILSPDDFDTAITENEKRILEYIEANEESFLPNTPENNTIKRKLRNAQAIILTKIKGFSTGENPMLPANALEYALRKNQKEFNTTLRDVAIKALSGTMETASFASFFKTNPEVNFAVITLPAQLDDMPFFTEGVSGLSSEYLDNFKSTAADFRLVFIGHEIAGHAFHKDIQRKPHFKEYKIDTRYTDESIKMESLGDIAGITIFEKAKEQNLTSGADTPAEFAALRALGAFYNSTNISSCRAINDINTHYTTLLFNPKSSGSFDNFDLKKTPALSVLPPLINRIADAISGFVAAQDSKEEMKHNPNAFTPEQKLFFKSLPSEQSKLLKNLDAFAELGESIRLGTIIGDSFATTKANPQYHHAALAFIKEHNLLEKIKSEMGDDYAFAIDDLLQDFTDAAEKYAPKLKNPEISVKMTTRLNASRFANLNYDVFIDPFTAEKLSHAPKKHPHQEVGLN